MNQELPAARRAFADAVRRQTPGTDLPRYLAVLEALLTWTAKQGGRIELRRTKRDDTLRFVHAGTQETFWSAHAARTEAPRLELHLATGRPGSEERRADAMRTLNTYSSSELLEGERLRIRFGALKNKAALAAVLALMDRLLTEPAAQREPAERAG